MQKPKQKLTNKEMTSVMTNMAMRLEQAVNMVINQDRLFTEYMEYKGETEAFTDWLKEKLEKEHGNETKKTEDK